MNEVDLIFEPENSCLPVFFFFFNLFYWSIVDLQCCVNSCCTAKWFSYTYIYVPFHILFHYDLSQSIAYSSMCYRVGPCCWSVLYILFASANPKLPLHPSPTHPSPLVTTSLFSLSASQSYDSVSSSPRSKLCPQAGPLSGEECLRIWHIFSCHPICLC